MPKIKEIAKQLSLSPATVSKTLSGNYGKGTVAASTATRILDFCLNQGYLGRAERDRILLRMKIQANHKKIFCISSYEDLWGYNALFSFISRQLQHNGQYTSFFTVKSEADLSRFPYEEANAVIVFGRITPDIFSLLNERSLAVVLVDNSIETIPCHTVNSNNLASAAKAVGILAKAGHKRIAFMCRHEDKTKLRTYNLHQRQSGYIVGMANHNLDTSGLIFTMNAADSEISSEPKTIEKDLKALANNILNSKPRPTAVVAANDLTAHVLRLVARERGLNIPNDLSIIGYDGQHRIPNVIGFEPVSTMVVNNIELARAAIDLAYELIVDPSKAARNIEIPTEYEDMGTVAEVQK